MTSKTDIYNGAIRLVGGKRVTSPTDGSKNANVANDIYDELLEDLLASANWKFAKKTVQLAQSATAPTAGFDFAYNLPGDHIRTIGAWDNDALAGNMPFREEIIASVPAIVCDSNQVYLQYVFLQTDENLYSPNFKRALIYALARDLAVPIAESNTLEDRHAAKAKSALLRAQSVDSLGTFPKRRPRGTWATNRGGRFYSDNFRT